MRTRPALWPLADTPHRLVAGVALSTVRPAILPPMPPAQTAGTPQAACPERRQLCAGATQRLPARRVKRERVPARRRADTPAPTPAPEPAHRQTERAGSCAQFTPT